MTQNNKTRTEGEPLTVQETNPAELVAIDGGLVLWPHQLEVYSLPTGDGLSLR
jgi:hypothetical protein